MKKLELTFPHIHESFRSKIGSYRDNMMEFRRMMLRNVYCLRDMPD